MPPTLKQVSSEAEETTDLEGSVRLRIGQSQAMQRIGRDIPRIAAARRTTLIYGPTGSGKEVVARELHLAAFIGDAPFVPVHCAALPEGVVESELFGHVRGAFTGATHTRSGLVVAAERGTLFLDEIDSLAPALQAKLLRFIESGEYRALGSDRAAASAAWILAATNADLGRLVATGRFRADLFHRLDVMRVDVPPLLDRADDIIPLAELFLHRLGPVAVGRRFAAAARDAMLAYGWPGNVRELKHKIERAGFMARRAEIEPDELGLPAANEHGAMPEVPVGDRVTLDGLWTLIEAQNLSLPEALVECERVLVERALAKSGGNRREAARLIGVEI